MTTFRDYLNEGKKSHSEVHAEIIKKDSPYTYEADRMSVDKDGTIHFHYKDAYSKNDGIKFLKKLGIDGKKIGSLPVAKEREFPFEITIDK
jgi:hypothetical protein